LFSNDSQLPISLTFKNKMDFFHRNYYATIKV
jgi:hypothetical protein